MRLPSRHTTTEMQEGVLRSAQSLLRAEAAAPQKALALWKVVGAALPVAMLAILAARDRSAARAAGGGVPFDRTQLVSADLAGVRVSPGDLVDLAPSSPEGGAAEAPTVATSPSPSPLPSRGGPSRTPSLPPSRPRSGAAVPAGRPRCETCAAARLGVEEATETLYEDGFGLEVPVVEEPPKLRIPLGTRIPAVLSSPVTTSPEGAPVTAEATSDVVSAGRVAIPAGARLEGVAFGTESDDRARILITSVVLDGRTVPLPAVALAAGGDLGLPGKVLSRGSKGKHGGSLLLRALGGAASYGLGGGAGIAGAALSQLGGGLSQDLSNLTRDWTVSDKAVRVSAGTAMVVYVRSESVIP